jgi:hypothetical protein
MKTYVLLFVLFFYLTGICQVSNYSKTTTTSTWSYNSSPTVLTGLGSGVNDLISVSAVNIGFDFVYDGTIYTQFKASSNGFITFKTTNTAAQPTNNLKTSTERVIVAPLWDDNQTGASGNVNYKLTGTLPNRILTIEWRALRWNKGGFSTGTIDTQIKLYETTNIIEFLYNRGVTSGTNGYTFGNSGGIGASIGVNGATSGDFISFSDLKSNATASTTTEITTIGATPTNLAALTKTQADAVINGVLFRLSPPPIALPIELLYFKGVPSENHNHITWSTSSEHNNNYFEIETTIDGIEYHSITRMSGSGNSQTKINYEFDDYNIDNGVNYYRLKQTDYDGKFIYSDIISIDNRIKPKIVSRMVSLMGTEVNEMYRGIVIVEYTDGSIEKIIR